MWMARLWLLLACAVSAVSVVSRPARAQSIEVGGGVRYLRWHADASPGPGASLTLGSATRPFVLRALTLKVRDLYGLELGLDHLSSQVLQVTGFADREDAFAIAQDPAASLLGGNARFRLSKTLWVQGDLQLRRFQLTRTLESRLAPQGSVTYLPRAGAAIVIPGGASSTWYTASRDYQVGILWDMMATLTGEPGGVLVQLGYHRLSYDAPVLISMTDGAGGNVLATPLGARMSAHLVDVAAVREARPSPQERPIDYGLRLSAQLGELGLQSHHLSASGGVAIGLGGDASVGYAFRGGGLSGAITVGLAVTWLRSLVTTTTAPRRDIPHPDLQGDPTTWPAGREGRLRLDRKELSWGPYVSLVLTHDLAAPGEAGPDIATMANGIEVGTTRVEPKSGLTFVFMAGGSFNMGCAAGDDACFANEPRSRQQVEPFWIGATEVTVSAWERCVTAGACVFVSDRWGSSEDPRLNTCNSAAGRPDHPINCMTPLEAALFCRWLGGQLPSAVQWEFAAKSGQEVRYPWGNAAVDGSRANFCDKHCPDGVPPARRQEFLDKGWVDREADDGWPATAPVETFVAGKTPWGLWQMSGNVLELTRDDIAPEERERRGGGFVFDRRELRTSYRLGGQTTTEWNPETGLRCVLPP